MQISEAVHESFAYFNHRRIQAKDHLLLFTSARYRCDFGSAKLIVPMR